MASRTLSVFSASLKVLESFREESHPEHIRLLGATSACLKQHSCRCWNPTQCAVPAHMRPVIPLVLACELEERQVRSYRRAWASSLLLECGMPDFT